MVYMLVRLQITNYAKWKTFFDERSATRKESGSKEAHLFRNKDDPNEVVILFDWDNMENAQKYMKSDELRRSLQKVGATYSSTYLDEVEKTT
jgi:quinol monooxygenase YgiN